MVPTMREHVVIIGAGRIGTAVGRVLKKNGHQVMSWDVVPGRVKGQKLLEKIIPAATIIILCVPSWATRECLLSFRDFLSSSAVILSFAKGVEALSGKTVDHMLAELLPSNSWGLVGGPMMAEEIEKGKGGVAVIATMQKKTFQRVVDACSSSSIRFEHSTDTHGVAIAGVLKGLYAFCLGLVEGGGWGINRRGWLAACAIQEMLRIGRGLDVPEETLLGPAGIGDFVATAFSPFSRSRSVGETVFRTGTCCPTSEATVSIAPVIRMLGRRTKGYPVLTGIARIIERPASAASVLSAWLELEPRMPPRG